MEKTLGAKEFAEEVQAGSISALEHASKIVEEIEKKNPHYHHFNCFEKDFVLDQARALEKEIKKGRKGKLLGVPVSVKDCLCVKGLESRAGSKVLGGYRPVFDATAVAKAKAEGAIILGKSVQDEFGFGTFSVNVGAGEIPLNPIDTSRSCGGSSGGAAGFAALTEHTHIAMAESTGGSIAAPASFCGMASITPTYGLVSRYGLMDYANSLDKIGAIGKSVEDAWLLLSVMAGKDPMESTTIDSPPLVAQGVKGLRIGIPFELMESISDKKIKEACLAKISRAQEIGAKVIDVKLPLNTQYGLAAYYIIAMSEASTNLAKYCGMRYGLQKKLEGNFNEYFSAVRSEGFGEEAKRRILIGTFARMSGFRDAYYMRAMKVRSLLIKEFRKVFSKTDLLTFPAMPMAAPTFSQIEKLTPLQHYSADLCTVPANLCGLPHATVNAGLANGLPAGLMVCANHLDDARALSFAHALEALQ